MNYSGYSQHVLSREDKTRKKKEINVGKKEINVKTQIHKRLRASESRA